MESFIVYSCSVKEIDSNFPPEDSIPPNNFRLVVLSDQEWDQIPKIFPKESNLSMDLLTGNLAIHPLAKRLSPSTYLVCYRDIDSEGKELAISFLFSSSEFVMIGWNGITLEKIKAWAQSGILENPFNLAQVLGSRVLRHHQRRLEYFEDLMDNLEELILKGPRSTHLAKIIFLHRQVIGLKKSLNAHQYIFTRLANTITMDSPGIWQELVQDTQRELDNIRQSHELVENLREAYQAAVDNRSNDIMKWLTLLATILLPINLMTSFFGMNFENMPLLHKSYGIIVFYLASVIIAIVAFIFFWKKKWLRK
ncbi:MAG: magnesium transporter CorA family protein [Desulfitobacteriaceae bacterium]